MDKKIMIIDDSSTMRQTVCMCLSTLGYNVIEAVNGIDALEKIKDNTIGLFICDVNMAEMDGITFLKKIKVNESYCHTPVLMLTTESSEDKIAEGKKAGAKAWIIKPFQPTQLIDAVKKLISIN